MPFCLDFFGFFLDFQPIFRVDLTALVCYNKDKVREPIFIVLDLYDYYLAGSFLL